jgi:hypothetical protein
MVAKTQLSTGPSPFQSERYVRDSSRNCETWKGERRSPPMTRCRRPVNAVRVDLDEEVEQ